MIHITSSTKLLKSRFVTILLLVLITAICAQNSDAAQVMLNWEKLSDPVTGYKIHYGTSSGDYTQVIDVGNVTTYTITNLASGTTYYIAATDYDAVGNESGLSNEVVAAIPAKQQYTLSVGKAGTGSGTVSGTGINCGTVCSGSYSAGTKVALTATADADSVFSGWSNGSTGTFNTVMNASTTVTATFTKVYTITTTSDANGTITPSGNPTVSQATNGTYTIQTIPVNSGASQTFTLTPKTGYHLSTLLADGTSVGTPGTYTFSNVTANHTLSASFSNKSYTITARCGTGGSISPSGATTVYRGASKTFTITPKTGYHIARVTIDGTSVGVVSTYTFSNVTASHTIAATFAANTYTITSSTGANGRISPLGSSTVKSGSCQKYTITPASGFHIADVKVDGATVGAVSSYTFSNVVANHTISASFSNKGYTITASCGTGGTISPSGVTIVNAGVSQTYIITPATGYHIAAVTIDGYVSGPWGAYTFDNINSNHVISASFSLN